MPNPRESVLFDWACRHLGVEATATSAEVSAAFLRKVGRDRLLPPASTTYAVRLLRREIDAPTSDLGRQQALLEAEAALQAEVDAFADKPPENEDEYRRCWEDLNWRCSWMPSLAARLKRLQKCVPAAPKLGGGDEPANLIPILAQLAGMASAGARRRHDLMRDVFGDRDRWEAAALKVQRTMPLAADLDATFFGYLTKRKQLEAQQRKIQWMEDLPRRMRRRNFFTIVFVLVVLLGLIQYGSRSGGDSRPEREKDKGVRLDYLRLLQKHQHEIELDGKTLEWIEDIRKKVEEKIRAAKKGEDAKRE